jgi:hypothetical protein
MTKEALTLALKALRFARDDGYENEVSQEAITAIKQALAAPVQEPVAWKNAAIRLGEELSSVGPAGYYDMTAEQWLDWAMTQQPRGKNSLPAAQRQWVGLNEDEIDKLKHLIDWTATWSHGRFAYEIEQLLKIKNT